MESPSFAHRRALEGDRVVARRALRSGGRRRGKPGRLRRESIGGARPAHQAGQPVAACGDGTRLRRGGRASPRARVRGVRARPGAARQGAEPGRRDRVVGRIRARIYRSQRRARRGRHRAARIARGAISGGGRLPVSVRSSAERSRPRPRGAAAIPRDRRTLAARPDPVPRARRGGPQRRRGRRGDQGGTGGDRARSRFASAHNGLGLSMRTPAARATRPPPSRAPRSSTRAILRFRSISAMHAAS